MSQQKPINLSPIRAFSDLDLSLREGRTADPYSLGRPRSMDSAGATGCAEKGGVMKAVELHRWALPIWK